MATASSILALIGCFAVLRTASAFASLHVMNKHGAGFLRTSTQSQISGFRRLSERWPFEGRSAQSGLMLNRMLKDRQNLEVGVEDDTIWHVMPEDQPDAAQSQWSEGLWTASDQAMDLRENREGVWCESIEGVGGAWMLHDVLSTEECNKIISLTERMGYVEYDLNKNTHAAVTWIASLEAVVKPMFERCKPFLPQDLPSRDLSYQRNITSLNGRLRCYRYLPDGNQIFRRHLDDSFFASGLDRPGGNRFVWDLSKGQESSMLTFLLYLSDDFEGGHTVFYPPSEEYGGSESVTETVLVRPVKGSVLCFYQTLLLGQDDETPWERAPLHEGSVLLERAGSSPKYVIRSDVMYTHNRSS